jgi:hypothetical protein
VEDVVRGILVREPPPSRRKVRIVRLYHPCGQRGYKSGLAVSSNLDGYAMVQNLRRLECLSVQLKSRIDGSVLVPHRRVLFE